jgi:hypothetical protein
MEHLIVLVHDIIERGFVSPEMYSLDMSGSKTDEGETSEGGRSQQGEGWVRFRTSITSMEGDTS